METSNISNWIDNLNNALILDTPKISELPPNSAHITDSKSLQIPTQKKLPRRPLSAEKSIPTKVMVTKALRNIPHKTRKGLSLSSIRKFIAQNYCVTDQDIKSRMHFIKKFIKELLENGQLVRVKGVGFTGSFRVPANSLLRRDENVQLETPKAKKTKHIGSRKSTGSVKRLARSPKIVRPKPMLDIFYGVDIARD